MRLALEWEVMRADPVEEEAIVADDHGAAEKSISAYSVLIG